MSTVAPSKILRKLKKSADSDDTSKKGTEDEQDEQAKGKGSKRNALIDFIAKNKK